MSSFTTALQLEFDYEGDPKRPFILTTAFTYRIGNDEYRWVTVPVGFRTDFASIPRPFRNIFSPTGRYGKAAVCHDYLYNRGWIGQLFIDDLTGDTFEHHTYPTRKEADDILMEGMKVLGVGRITRFCVYWAVRIGGRGEF